MSGQLAFDLPALQAWAREDFVVSPGNALALASLDGEWTNRRLILTEELSPGERRWLNRYHAEVLEKLGSRVSGATLDWLRDACAPL